MYMIQCVVLSVDTNCFLFFSFKNLQSEVTRFRQELQSGSQHIDKKIDLLILVHNLSHRIPNYPILSSPSSPPPQPVLSLLLNEVKALSIPWIMAITNKFSVSAHLQNRLISSSMEAYDASPNATRVVNSLPFFMPNGPRRPFGRKEAIMPVEGVHSLREVVYRALRDNEEATLQVLVVLCFIHFYQLFWILKSTRSLHTVMNIILVK
jgi:hypothetical protein